MITDHSLKDENFKCFVFSLVLTVLVEAVATLVLEGNGSFVSGQVRACLGLQEEQQQQQLYFAAL